MSMAFIEGQIAGGARRKIVWVSANGRTYKARVMLVAGTDQLPVTKVFNLLSVIRGVA